MFFNPDNFKGNKSIDKLENHWLSEDNLETLGIDKNNHLSKGKNSNVIVFSDTELDT